MNSRNKFYLGFSVLFSISTLVILLLKSQKPTWVNEPTVWFTQAFLGIVILISHFLSSKGLKNKAVDFHIYYMGSMGIRFLLSLIYLFLMVYFYQNQAWPIVINFFLLYFLYTSFEIYSLMANLRAEN
jgi:hypothetical protein